MSFITYAILLTCMLLGCLASVGVRADEGPNTYNFYFQKAPGPVTVNQGGVAAPAAVSAAPVAAPLPATSTIVAPPSEETYSRKRLFLSVGYAVTNPSSEATPIELYSGQKNQYLSGQFALKGEYDLTDRFAVTGELYKMKKEVGLNDVHAYDKNAGVIMGTGHRIRAKAQPSAKNVMDFGVGGAAHVVKLRSTTLSLIGGLVTVPAKHYADFSPGMSAPQGGVQHEKVFYAGARVRLIADNVWGVDLSHRELLGIGNGLTQVTLTFAL